MEIERIVKRVHEVLKKTHKNSISTSTMIEILTYSNKIFASKKQIDVFKEIIMTEKPRGVYTRLAKKYEVKPQRIMNIEQNIIEKIYLLDAQTTFENIESNEEKLNMHISNLGLNKKIMGLLEELHFYKIKDIFDIDKEYFERFCVSKKVNYDEIFERLKVLKINPPKSEHRLKLIEELDMTPRAYKYIKGQGICTNLEFIKNINLLLDNPKITDSTKKQIKELYKRVKEELNEPELGKEKEEQERKM